MIRINDRITLPDTDVEWTAIRAQGSGGQNVNKVSSAVHLRFDIHASSLPYRCKEMLLSYKDQRITREGTIIIKAQQYRTQEQNRCDALERLARLIERAIHVDKKRVATKPTKGSVRRRLESKKSRSKVKSMRGKITIDR